MREVSLTDGNENRNTKEPGGRDIGSIANEKLIYSVPMREVSLTDCKRRTKLLHLDRV